MELTILDLSASEVRRFLLKQESFCNIGLPQYFNFQELLDRLFIDLVEKKYSYRYFKANQKTNNDLWDSIPGNYQGVNYLFLQNKDGRYSWRPLQIINPAIYVCLVKEITEEDNWKTIIERFKELQSNDKIKCYSMPLINLSTQTDTANTILSWWNAMEQQSIELAMEYNYLMKTDISDCYSSIYTHSITWAMCDKEKAKDLLHNNKKKLSSIDIKRYNIGDVIDKLVQNMSYMQTNGIPQGSILMDFIAEMVLGYADKELSKRLSKNEFKSLDYKILRYRDDYRIYGKTQEEVVKIAKALTEVLSDLNLKLNTQKTLITQDLISDSIKSDKLYYLINDYRQLEKSDSAYSLQKHLLRIYKLSLEHPNSGSLQKALSHYYKRLCDWEELDLFKEQGSTMALLSILTNIGYNNPKVYREYVAIVSKIVSYETKEEKNQYINLILDKFHNLPNVGFLELWLQRLTIKDSRRKKYKEPLCIYAAGYDQAIWNFDWIKSDIKSLIESIPIIDKWKIINLPDVIEFKEIEQFNRY